jgi:hypothetical protein
MQMHGKKEKASSTVKDDKALRKTPIHCAFGTHQIPAFWPFFDGPANVCFKRTLECALPDVGALSLSRTSSRLKPPPKATDETR